MGVNLLKMMVCLLAIGPLQIVTPTAHAEEAVVEQAVDVDALFEKGMDAREEGRLQDAIMAFHSILSSQPLLHRARLELAVAYYKSMQYQDAMEQAQKVLDDPETPPNVRVAVLAFMAQAKTGASMVAAQSYWDFPVSIGYLHDSNANVGPGTTIIPGLGELDPNSASTSDSARVVNVGINHNYQTGKMLNCGEVPAMFFWQSGVNVYDRSYFDEDDYNLNVISLRTGPALITRGQWRANLNFQEDIIAYGGNKLANYHNIMPSVTLHFPYAIEATLDATFTWRDFERDIDEGRDSDYVAPRLSVGYVTPDKKIALQAGAQLFDENADADRYDNDGYNLFGGVSWNFIENALCYFNYNYRSIEYDGTILDLDLVLKERDEDEDTVTVGASYTFKTENFLNDWTFDVKAMEINYDSNTYLYDYDRTQYEFTLSKTF
jgi:tetratricopeptide (TPR) repeat protein